MSLNTISSYKIKLKLIIKNSFSLAVFQLISLVNNSIFFWMNSFTILDCFSDICGALDVYLYKLLWKWAKRRHPRRPNTWIFNKYWKYFSGQWKFFCLKSTTGNVYILKSHFIKNILFLRLPYSINVLNLFNLKKVNKFFFRSFGSFFLEVFKFLWCKQKGICFLCHRNLVIIDVNSVSLYYLSKNKVLLSNLALVHSYCR
jgi:RNA-directed DNA polymerase